MLLNDRPTRFSDAQVAHILNRAAEIDARGDSMSADELRSIAAEAGIDPRATDEAIRELVAEEKGAPVISSEPGPSAVEQSHQVPAPETGWSLPWRIATGGAVGAACGFIYGLSAGIIVDPLYPLTANAVIGLATAALYLIARGVRCMRRGDQVDFQLENLTVWFGAALGALPMITYGWHIDNVLVPLVAAWFLVSIVGGLLVRLGRKDESAPAEPPKIGAGTG